MRRNSYHFIASGQASLPTPHRAAAVFAFGDSGVGRSMTILSKRWMMWVWGKMSPPIRTD